MSLKNASHNAGKQSKWVQTTKPVQKMVPLSQMDVPMPPPSNLLNRKPCAVSCQDLTTVTQKKVEDGGRFNQFQEIWMGYHDHASSVWMIISIISSIWMTYKSRFIILIQCVFPVLDLKCVILWIVIELLLSDWFRATRPSASDWHGV